MLTNERLRRYRMLRTRHLQHGIRNIRRYAAEYAELDAEVRSSIESLPDQEMNVMQMYYCEGMSCIAIGIRMHYSDGHVRRIKRRAIARLAQ